jgi:hypothetical protein
MHAPDWLGPAILLTDRSTGASRVDCRVHSLATFPTCLEANAELQREIVAARAELEQKGVLSASSGDKKGI